MSSSCRACPFFMYQPYKSRE
ncbi:MAG: hypothetical protein JNK08_03680 [Sediminibacterium sp.]|nr:hypothetical protein [Sediminibacterium sp.]